MKHTLFTLALVLLTLLSASCGDKKKVVYQNPLPMAFGDPFLLKASDGKFYMYGTGGVQNGFKVYSSDDLVTWKDEGPVYQGGTSDSWGTDCFWAPEVYERDGKYYLWFSANWKENPTQEQENFRIGVAVANKTDDASGKTYLYYSRCCYKHAVESEVSAWAKTKGWFDEIEESWIYGVELKPDFSGVIGEPVALLCPPKTMDDPQAKWENRSVTTHEVNRRWTEGSYMVKHGNLYYMLYSANFFGGKNYAVGYATSQSPLGPFTKAANNPVLQKNTEQGGIVTGTGHCMLRTNGIHRPHRHPTRRETGSPRTEYGFTENHILKLSGADCTAFHGSLFPVALLYIPRLMKIKKDISIHNNPLHICS